MRHKVLLMFVAGVLWGSQIFRLSGSIQTKKSGFGQVLLESYPRGTQGEGLERWGHCCSQGFLGMSDQEFPLIMILELLSRACTHERGYFEFKAPAGHLFIQNGCQGSSVME